MTCQIYSHNGRNSGMSDKNDNYLLFSGSKLWESIRNGGYKNTSYAIAEIIDNSIDAGAKNIEVIFQDKADDATGRYTLSHIGMLDDGAGMDQETLRRSLIFGEGKSGNKAKEIGKFGMGLPNSSLSQCMKVEVYSWQNSSDVIYSCINGNEIKKGNLEIPKPVISKIPKIWKDTFSNFSKKSGTFVIWSKLDRSTWKTSKKMIEHSEFLIGRVYRKFLVNNSLNINMKTIEINGDEINEVESKLMLPNDPLYLTKPSSTPSEWGNETMFKLDSQPTHDFKINYNGEEHIIKTTYSLVEDKVRDPENNKGNPGSTKHGKHANRNMGVSIIRAGREIDLDTNLTISEQVERWWGVEIDIPTSLDDVVGLTNNKQHTTILSDLMNQAHRCINEDDEEEIVEDLKTFDPSRSELFGMIRYILCRIRSMRRRLSFSAKGTRSRNKGGKDGIDVKIDSAIEKERSEGEKGTSEEQREEFTTEQRIEILSKEIQDDDGMEEDEAKKRATDIVKEKQNVVFIKTDLPGDLFFDVQSIAGIIRIKINSNHEAYKNLLSLTEPEEHKNLDDKKKFELASDGLRLLLASWAQYENITINIDTKKQIQRIRNDWGKYLDDFCATNSN